MDGARRRSDGRRHLTLQNTIHWVKSIAIDREAAGAAARLDRDLAVGHYKPINSNRFVNDCHEFIFHFTVDGKTPLDRQAIGVPYQDASNVTRWAGRRTGAAAATPGSSPTKPSRAATRSPPPRDLPSPDAEHRLKLHGLSRVKVAMDPFLGLGSSALAALGLGVDFVGVEIDEHHLTEAVARVRKSLG